MPIKYVIYKGGIIYKVLIATKMCSYRRDAIINFYPFFYNNHNLIQHTIPFFEAVYEESWWSDFDSCFRNYLTEAQVATETSVAKSVFQLLFNY